MIVASVPDGVRRYVIGYRGSLGLRDIRKVVRFVCVLCWEFAAEGHWSDDAAIEAGDRLRYRRTHILSRVLAPYGLGVSYPGSGPLVLIADRKGRTEVAASLPAVWETVDRLLSRQIDVLDQSLLEELASGDGS